MEARDLAEHLKSAVDEGLALSARDGFDGLETGWAHEDSDFFVRTDGEGTFLVAVMKVSE